MSDIENLKVHYPSEGSFTQPAPRSLGNPGSLGLFSFASTTFMLSLFNVSARNIHTPNVVVGMACFTGGLAQLLAGMWEFPNGNTFGATAFTSYGAFWLSYASILLPNTGIIAAYTDPEELASALGIFLFAWFIVTVMFLIASLRKSVAFIVLFGFLAITFGFLGAGEFSGNPNITKIGGGCGLFTAAVAYYIGLSDLLAAERAAVVSLPTGAFKHY
ncbi:GPR1/FUN34/yaaH family-domain-containing protein [Mycena metata]|uniref:GPR1/FUN34/yaaH family-domain-containing protein n=1 Tax=Mycena metata TaxID=1033252 RepID=A0AAD7NQH8_9AGAR|nr:GPR1/FUN34/yaaH family-domain-containing protein [Mycena metata]